MKIIIIMMLAMTAACTAAPQDAPMPSAAECASGPDYRCDPCYRRLLKASSMKEVRAICTDAQHANPNKGDGLGGGLACAMLWHTMNRTDVK